MSPQDADDFNTCAGYCYSPLASMEHPTATVKRNQVALMLWEMMSYLRHVKRTWQAHVCIAHISAAPRRFSPTQFLITKEAQVIYHCVVISPASSSVMRSQERFSLDHRNTALIG
ncbi:hypothetical protein PoB_004409400 [Plakobranchus ocellatus]|uniref:Uncharacterized protein n=1 Tax=Plakobranchus ocellatus TaxID=259542 RepID=A0AAV4BFF0_9GAST|nr:hypothetical protein PoB_004409400 [Plakobranchus ocellatus]